MNPLDALRAPDVYVDPLTRAARHGAAQEAAEFRQMELNRQAAAEDMASRAEMQYAIERAEIARDGYSQRQMLERRQALDAAKRERRDELLAELQQIDPGYTAAATRTASDVISDQLTRARAAAADEFMLTELVRFDKREQARKDQLSRQRIQRAEDELTRSRGY